MNSLDLEVLELLLQLTNDEKRDVLSFSLDLIKRDKQNEEVRHWDNNSQEHETF